MINFKAVIVCPGIPGLEVMQAEEAIFQRMNPTGSVQLAGPFFVISAPLVKQN